MMLFYAQEPLGGLRTTPNHAFFLGFPECTKRIKPLEDLFIDFFIIIHLFIWTYLRLIVIRLQKECVMLFYTQEPLGGLRTTPNPAFFLGFPECNKRIKPLEDLFIDFFIIIHLFIWTYLRLIVIRLQKECMMLFYTQEPLGGLRTTPNPAFFLGFPECNKRIKPLEDLFIDFFIIIHLFIWTYLRLIVIRLEKECMMLFYTQEPLGGLRTTPNPAFFLGFPECNKKIKPLEDLFSDFFIIINLFIWTYLAV